MVEQNRPTMLKETDLYFSHHLSQLKKSNRFLNHFLYKVHSHDTLPAANIEFTIFCFYKIRNFFLEICTQIDGRYIHRYTERVHTENQSC